MQGALEHEINGRAADIAVFAEHGGTVADVGLGQSQLVAQREQHITPAGVQDPAGNALAFHTRRRQGSGKKP